MATEEVKQSQVVVGVWPTDWVCVTPSIKYNTITLVIPGNPGVVSYYTEFCRDLCRELHHHSAVWAISHSCHTEKDPTPNSTVEREVTHKVMFIRKFIPPGLKLRLVGHSIGCQMILKALDQLKDQPETSNSAQQSSTSTSNNPSMQFDLGRSYLLFPTIERMSDTPRGVYVWPLLAYFWWLPPFIGSCLSIMPKFVQNKLVRMFLSDGFGSTLPLEAVESTICTARPDMMRNMLDLAYDELVTVTALDAAAVSRHKDSLVFYYGSNDSWCPVEFREELQHRVPGVLAYLCQRGIDHAFVLRWSSVMAHELATIVADVEGLEQVPDST